MELSSQPTIVVKISEVGPLIVLYGGEGRSAGFSISLLALPQGFVPTEYDWVMDPESPAEQRATGSEASMTVSIGSKGAFTYDHEVRLKARDEEGNSASATYAIHANPPAGRLIPIYHDLASRIGATYVNEPGHRLLAYETVLVKAEIEGFVGRTTFVWKVGGRMEEARPDSETLAVGMLITGDPSRIDSYEGTIVEATVEDEVGQSIMMLQFIDAVVESPPADEQEGPVPFNGTRSRGPDPPAL